MRVAGRQHFRSPLALFCAAGLSLLVLCAPIYAQARRTINLDDLARMRDVRDPQCSPDGKWVAYTVSTIDVKADKHNSHVWMVSADGAKDIQVTESQESESGPQWSPDGKYLAFTSSRPGTDKGNQVWILNREGGEATQLTDVKGKLQSYEWSPDSKRLALVVGDPDPDEPQGDSAKPSTPKPPKPIVIDRYHYKQDVVGYLLSNRHSYIYLFDIATKKSERLTKGEHDESGPVWSPDGTRLAFVALQANGHGDIAWISVSGGTVHRLTHDAASTGGDSRPTWSPKGGLILYQRSAGGNQIRTVNVTNGAQHLVTQDGMVDPEDSVSDPDFAPDGVHVMFLALCEAPGECDGNFNTPNVMSSNLDGSDRVGVSHSCGCEGDAQYSEFAASPDGQSFVAVIGPCVSPWGGWCGIYPGGVLHAIHPDWQPLTPSTAEGSEP